MLSHDVTLPVFLDPGATGCITPSAYAAAKDTLNARFGRTLLPTDANYTTIFANFMNQYFGFSLAYDQYAAYESSHSGLLCNQMPYASVNADPYDCVKNQLSTIVASGLVDWNNYIATNRQAFIADYENTCSLAQASAGLSSLEQLYHYTLYYYDQADNLVRTVPPEGVNLVSTMLFNYIDKARDADTTTVVYHGPAVNSNQTAATDTLSAVLSAPHGAVELWLYNGGTPRYHFVATTADSKYQFQAGIAGDTLSVDVWPLAGSAAWHYKAGIRALQPLNPFAMVVFQGDTLGKGPASPQLYLNGTRLTTIKTAGARTVVPDSLQMLKHMRLYRHLLSTSTIARDVGQYFFDAADKNYAGWFRFNVPATGSQTTVNDTSTRETAYYDTYPAHGMPTTYTYNGTNQVSLQLSPDGGYNRYWYDLLSRLVLSQNDKQNPLHNYSYTLYDTLGRINEVGQKNGDTVTIGSANYISNAKLATFMTFGTNSQITGTHYDTPMDTLSGHTNGIASIYTQTNLRKRVAASTYTETQGSPALRATYYSYDIDGNVTRLWQQLDGLYVNSTNAGLKRVDYEYDLVSGKVNFVRYQDGQPDEFYYAYSYDADNRLTGALSSNRAVVDTLTGSVLPPSVRSLDARYYYYLHGPLRRVELGDDGASVQGLDYAYTLQGWLKGVNSATGASYYDMGLDSTKVAKDALGYSLGYYPNDYSPIGGTTYKAFTLQYSQTTGDITGQSLYNGNISNATMAINQLGTPVGYTYHYDQLNRLKKMREYAGIHGTTWSRTNISLNYQENVTYDGNGNIQTYGRNGASPTAQTIDSLTYHYPLTSGKLKNNRLNYIHDAISSSGYNLDLRNQTNTTNYRYDVLGNLIYDAYSGITGNGGVNSITWSVYNKPLKIYKAGADSITYAYNTANQRVSKKELGITTWYVRDAQGNPLALYDNIHGSTNWREQDLYGSSRLGMWMPNIADAGSSILPWDTVGKKLYELDNHLGNVMATISDKRLQHSSNGTTIDYYTADITAAQDYYPFGMLMPGRIYTFGGDSSYRYGFNGKENDNTIKGVGNSQDYGERIYDGRVGRFLSVDPLTKSYPELTPYQFGSNSPIANIDLDGLEAKLAIAGNGGEHTEYTPDVVAAFKDRANKLTKLNFTPVPVHNGPGIISAFKEATKTQGGITAIISYTHSGANGLYLDDNQGFYTSSVGGGVYGANVDQIAAEVKKGTIKFKSNAIWIFASCNAGNADNVIGGQKEGTLNIARNIALTLGIKTIGARGYVSPVEKNNKETGSIWAGAFHGVSFSNMGFILFEPIKTTTTKIVPMTIWGIPIPFTHVKETVTTTTVKETPIGNPIDPTKYVPPQ